MRPFGPLSAEDERASGELAHLYLESNPYYVEALQDETDIIVGRRGAGKSSLATMLTSARRRDGHRVFDVRALIDDSRPFRTAIDKVIDAIGSTTQPFVVDLLGDVWSHALWNVLIVQYAKESEHPKSTHLGQYVQSLSGDNKPLLPSEALVRSMKRIASRAGTPAPLDRLSDVVNDLNRSTEFTIAKKEVETQLDGGMRAAIVLDALDEYEITNKQVQVCLGGLLRAVATLGRGRMHKNAILKCFLPAEIYQEVVDHVVQHQAKTFDNSLAIHWRRKDLLRMLCWRMLYALDQRKQLPLDLRDYDRGLRWDDYGEIYEKVWSRFFPAPVMRDNVPVDPFDHISRFSQQRPRQVIAISNAIAAEAARDNAYPGSITWDHVRSGVRQTVALLAVDVIGSFNQIHKDARRVLDRTLRGHPQLLTHEQVDEVAARATGMRADTFWRMVLEMGVIGVVRFAGARYIHARYEYAVRHRLTPDSGQLFAVHPMFHQFLDVPEDADGRVVRPLGPDEEVDDQEV